MKKVLALGLLALGLIALSQQEASAWKNSRFGIGLNWDYQSGGNSFFWGLWRNGQPPGPGGFGDGMPYHGHGHKHATQGNYWAMPAQQPGFAPVPYGYFDMPTTDPSYAMPYTPYVPYTPYGQPFQFATYPPMR